MYARLLERAMRLSVADTPATFVAGARQTGKSTLVQSFADRTPGFRTLTFDDPPTLAAARADPQGFVRSLGDRAVLDEVQRAPEILVAIKRAIDADRRPGRFVLTGSANLLTLPRVSESLAGRMEILTLWPLAQCELEGVTPGFIDACFEGRPERLPAPRLDRPALVRRAVRGGYPEVVARPTADARRRWFDAYLATLLQRDLRELAAIERIVDVPRLLAAAAARTGGPLNVADLGRTLGMNQMTLKRYLMLLETLFVVFRLPPWFENLGKRLARTPKLYVNDSGLLAHLLGIDDAEAADGSPALGPLIETHVVTELVRMAPHSTTHPRLYHLRTSDGVEVDVVLEGRRQQLVGVEVKASSTVTEGDFKGLRLLQRGAAPGSSAGWSCTRAGRRSPSGRGCGRCRSGRSARRRELPSAAGGWLR